MIRVTRKIEFSAAHFYNNPSLSPEENLRLFGKCNNPHGHGHNYRIEVTVGGTVDPDTGMAINMATLDAVVRKEVLERFDHMNLNLDPMFGDRVSTTENLCIGIFDLLHGALEPAELEKVRIEETENNFFEYSGS